MRWIERTIELPLPPEQAFPLAVEPGTLADWLVQVREIRPRGFLAFRPRVRHGGLRLDLDVEVLRVDVPHEVEASARWRTVEALLHVRMDDHRDGTRMTFRIGLDLPPAMRAGRGVVTAELGRLLAADLRRLRRLATEQAGRLPTASDAEHADPGVGEP